VQVRGSERAYMGYLCAQLSLAVFDPREYKRGEILSTVWRHPHPGSGSFAEAFSTHVRIGGDRIPFTLPSGGEVDMFTVNLNTALALGNDAVRLCARLHGQCEIHAWVDGPNRAWLAGIVEDGRRCGVLRTDQGWEALAGFLRERDDEPVVTSYSVCDQFPNAHTAGVTEDGAAAWYELPEAEQWAQAMERLRRIGGGLEMRPDHWTFSEFYFGGGQTAFTILNAAADAAKAAVSL
jgi:hypothetical protein